MSGVHLSDEEERVRVIVQDLLGCPVEQWDDQSSPGMHDLLARTAGGDAALEIVSDKDPGTRKRMAAGARLRSLTAAELDKAWQVGVGNRANINQVRARVPDLLALLEEANVFDVDIRGDDSAHVARLMELGPTHARVLDTAPAGLINFFTGMSWVGSVIPIDDLADYASSVLDANPDVAAKLGRSGMRSRHAVVVASADRMDVLTAMEGTQTDVPVRDPQVPEEITDVWLVPCTPNDRVLQWTRGRSWRFLGLTP